MADTKFTDARGVKIEENPILFTGFGHANLKTSVAKGLPTHQPEACGTVAGQWVIWKGVRTTGEAVSILSLAGR